MGLWPVIPAIRKQEDCFEFERSLGRPGIHGETLSKERKEKKKVKQNEVYKIKVLAIKTDRLSSFLRSHMGGKNLSICMLSSDLCMHTQHTT